MARRTRQRPAPRPSGIRLHKAMAEAGVGSRRACEELIEQGHVTVNGQQVRKMPVWVDPAADRVEVDGQAIRRPGRQRHLYLLVSKPRNVICTSRDPQGRRKIIDLVPHERRLFCVGRLDADSTGLVLLTDDGELANRLTHPRYGVPKTYLISVKGLLDDAEIDKLKRGLFLADRGGQAARARAAAVKVVQRDREKTRLEVTLCEGRNREIRRLLARLGHRVRLLQRIAIGPVRLKGIASGDWRELTGAERSALRRAARSSHPTRQ